MRLPASGRSKSLASLDRSENILFVRALEQASHGGELAGAVEAGAVSRADVTDLGAVLVGDAEGRRNADEITLFDSTGLAIQDLAVAKVAYSRAAELDLPLLDI